MDGVPVTSTVSIAAAGYNEAWLRDRIYEDPSVLGLGDLQAVALEVSQTQGGRLDLLLKNPDDDSMFEVELQLGATDESHIIRTIEYWDREKRRWPKRSHTAVLVAETITSRFYNVVRLLSEAVPLIGIQANIVQVGEAQALHFTKIIDTYEEPAEEAPGTRSYDEPYWQARFPGALACAKWYEALLRRFYGEVGPKYFDWYISYRIGGIARVWVNRRQRPDRAMVEVKYVENPVSEAADFLRAASIAATVRGDMKHLAFNVSLQELCARSHEHEWLVQRIAPNALLPPDEHSGLVESGDPQ